MLWYVVAWTGYHAPAEKKRKVIAMRVWLYSRLSRDEDSELNSLTNQQNILRGYAANNNCTVIGESADDNISGMHILFEFLFDVLACRLYDICQHIGVGDGVFLIQREEQMLTEVALAEQLYADVLVLIVGQRNLFR